MASSGNTWQKKLVAKQKKFALAQKVGTMTPLLARGKDTYWNARDQFARYQATIAAGAIIASFDDVLNDKAAPSGPKHDDERARLPMKAGWMPRRHKGAKAKAAALELSAAVARRDAQFAALVAAVGQR